MTAGAQRVLMAVIEYDGTAFAGSQVQPNARTVQGELEEALNRLIGERIRVRFAGRTDAGVHATGQVAAFCLPSGAALSRVRERLNALLPSDLAVRSLRPVATGFDPRRDARWRVYRYRILPTWRVIRLDTTMYVSAFDAGWEGHESATYKVMQTPHGPLYRGFRRMFDALIGDAEQTI